MTTDHASATTPCDTSWRITEGMRTAKAMTCSLSIGRAARQRLEAQLMQ